jgi:hypothetical protein
MGRLLMNAVPASGGYPWPIIPVERLDQYMAAPESASVGQNITSFAAFQNDLASEGLRGAAAPPVPARARESSPLPRDALPPSTPEPNGTRSLLSSDAHPSAVT